jgi:electron transfer flavoprotein alpha subunit
MLFDQESMSTARPVCGPTLLSATGGMAHTHVACDTAAGAVINTRAGAFAPDETRAAAGQVVDKSGDVGDLAATRTFLEVVAAEAGEVDITKSDVLVSIGRGIEDQENIELAEELAQAMGAVVSCSRPIVDAKWLEKARQVGTSGQIVKPKVYMALGISGSFQHLGGIKGNPFMIAVNKNPKTPIFQVADVGIVADILKDWYPPIWHWLACRLRCSAPRRRPFANFLGLFAGFRIILRKHYRF